MAPISGPAISASGRTLILTPPSSTCASASPGANVKPLNAPLHRTFLKAVSPSMQSASHSAWNLRAGFCLRHAAICSSTRSGSPPRTRMSVIGP